MSGHLFLVGMMGAGKTSLGPLVARRLSMDWADTDEEVTRESAMSVADLFASHGEEHFRRCESLALRRLLEGARPMVVSVGGGAVLDEANRALLRRSGIVVWLRADPATLARRVGDGSGRPLLGKEPTEALERISRERAELYEEVSHTVVDTDTLPLQDIAERIERMYRKRSADLAEGSVAGP